MCFDPEHGPLRLTNSNFIYTYEPPTDGSANDVVLIRIGNAQLQLIWLDLSDGPLLDIHATKLDDLHHNLGQFQIHLNTL